MKKMVRFDNQVLSLAVALTFVGCYTQMGSVRSDREYSYEEQSSEQAYQGDQYDSNASIINSYYYGGYWPSSYFRFSFGYYYPSYYWGWYDPFYSYCYDPFFYSPWICGTPFVTLSLIHI